MGAVLSVDGGSLDPQGEFHEMVEAWIGIALGDADVPERDAVIQVLEHVCFSTIISLATGRHSAARRPSIFIIRSSISRITAVICFSRVRPSSPNSLKVVSGARTSPGAFRWS